MGHAPAQIRSRLSQDLRSSRNPQPLADDDCHHAQHQQVAAGVQQRGQQTRHLVAPGLRRVGGVPVVVVAAEAQEKGTTISPAPWTLAPLRCPASQ